MGDIGSNARAAEFVNARQQTNRRPVNENRKRLHLFVPDLCLPLSPRLFIKASKRINGSDGAAQLMQGHVVAGPLAVRTWNVKERMHMCETHRRSDDLHPVRVRSCETLLKSVRLHSVRGLCPGAFQRHFMIRCLLKTSVCARIV